MTYIEARAALQLIAEEQLGSKLRAQERGKDARFEASKSALRAERAREDRQRVPDLGLPEDDLDGLR